MNRFFGIMVLCIFMCAQGYALPEPKPTYGYGFARINTLVFPSGPFKISITLPSGWVYGKMSMNGGNGNLTLYPDSGGYGSTMQINQYEDIGLLQGALENLKATFSIIKNLDNGFEVELPNAWYTCRIYGQSLIQIWYVLPRLHPDHIYHWEALTSCIAILDEN